MIGVEVVTFMRMLLRYEFAYLLRSCPPPFILIHDIEMRMHLIAGSQSRHEISRNEFWFSRLSQYEKPVLTTQM